MKKLSYIVLLGILCVAIQLKYPSPILAATPEEVVKSINDSRISNGFSSVEKNDSLTKAAQMKLKDMQTFHYWSHSNTITGEPWYIFMKKVGISGSIGETLARGYSSAEEVVTAWLASNSHRPIVLGSKYKQVGIAIGDVGYGNTTKTVIVAEFSK